MRASKLAGYKHDEAIIAWYRSEASAAARAQIIRTTSATVGGAAMDMSEDDHLDRTNAVQPETLPVPRAVYIMFAIVVVAAILGNVIAYFMY